MANEMIMDREVRIGFLSEGGKSMMVTVNRPDDALSDAEIFAAAKAMMDADLFKPDGTSLSSIKFIKLVDLEETLLDLETAATE